MTEVLKFKAFDAPAMIQYSPAASKAIGKDLWMVVIPFSFYTGNKEDNRTVTIPNCYLTDGATVPRIFWGFVPPWGAYGQAVILHDYLCEYLTVMNNGVPESISRKQADKMLNEAMKVIGVPSYLRIPIYNMVNVFRIIFNRRKPNLNRKKKMLEDRLRAEMSYSLVPLDNEERIKRAVTDLNKNPSFAEGE